MSKKKNNIASIGSDKSFDFKLFFSVMILLCIGLVMVASASSYYALTEFNNSNHFLVRQLAFAILGVIAMLVTSKINYRTYSKFAYVIYAVVLLLMILVLVPGIGTEVNGARRWIDLKITTFQPSELMKIALTLALSTYIVNNYKKLTSIPRYIVPSVFFLLVCIVMFFQNHLSGMIVMAFITGIIFLASGMKLEAKYIIPIVLIGALAIGGFLFAKGFRMDRITSFLNPEDDITGGNWQASQSLYAIGSGGLFGRGLGQSRQKYLWLPEAQNDFIFAVTAEELGFVGSTVIVCIFGYFIIRGIRTALKCSDLFGMLVATGITSMFAFQIIVNIAVVTKSMPVTGMPLPFFSYGGTSLLINLAAVGILLNISRHASK